MATCSAPLQQSGGGGGSGETQTPGPSIDLFNAPYYKCNINRYVSTSGSDSNDGTTQATAWLTLQHADAANVGPGACINVAPGTYNGVTVFHGGNAATATGYVVYRCQQMDACTITGTAGQNSNSSVWLDATNVSATKPNTVNYVQFDGFVMAAQANAAGGAYEVGFSAYNCNLTGACNTAAVASHHVWLLNSIVHGFGQAGIALGASDYFYAIHNTAYNNALRQCDAQGSGLGLNIAHEVPNYTPTADDETNPNPLLGTWQLGDGTFFHVVFEYNVTYNNYLSGCGKGAVTDSNGIIFDTNALPGGNSTDYHNPMLAAFNVSYNNGGGGVHIFKSYNVTVANNTSFNNYIDPDLNYGGLGAIDDNAGGNTDGGVTYSNFFYNNIAVSCTSAFPAGLNRNAAMLLGPTAGDDPVQGNITFMVTNNAACGSEIAVFNSQTYDTTLNKVMTNPQWVNVTFASPGTESTPPAGTNFALSPGSPAIGYGITKPYLPPSSVDVGACASTLTTCPK
jgi:hypothetical protein